MRTYSIRFVFPKGVNDGWRAKNLTQRRGVMRTQLLGLPYKLRRFHLFKEPFHELFKWSAQDKAK